MRKTARDVNVSPSTIHRWKERSWWSQGQRKRRERNPTAWTSEVKDIVITECTRHSNTTISQLRAVAFSQVGRRVSASTLRRGLHKAGFSRRRLSSKLLGCATPEQVSLFRSKFTALALPGVLVVSVDESHFSQRVMPLYGYCKRGSTPSRQQPPGSKGSWTSYSLLHAITSDGTHHSKLIKGSVTRAKFVEFVDSMPYPAGAVILMDNCPIHKGVNSTFNQKGYHPLFLSPYSPQFQPVELAFSAIKSNFRLAWPWSNGIPGAVEAAINAVTPAANIGFFRHAIRNING